jgi:hypothetical protein
MTAPWRGQDEPDVTHFGSAMSVHGGLKEGFILPIAVPGAITNGQKVEFVAPFDIRVDAVRTRAGAVTNPGDGDVTVDVLDDGTSILTAPLSYAAADTTYSETGIDAVIAAGSIVRIIWALTGTGPALSSVGLNID